MRNNIIYLAIVLMLLSLLACQPKVKQQETEAQETERLTQEKQAEDETAFQALSTYNGDYYIEIGENEGLNAVLTLQYNGDKTFDFVWTFQVQAEETQCNGKLQGKILMDRSQHGFYQENGCFVHFNFNGLYNNKMVVEIPDVEKDNCKSLQGECTFGGIYTMEVN